MALENAVEDTNAHQIVFVLATLVIQTLETVLLTFNQTELLATNLLDNLLIYVLDLAKLEHVSIILPIMDFLLIALMITLLIVESQDATPPLELVSSTPSQTIPLALMVSLVPLMTSVLVETALVSQETAPRNLSLLTSPFATKLSVKNLDFTTVALSSLTDLVYLVMMEMPAL